MTAAVSVPPAPSAAGRPPAPRPLRVVVRAAPRREPPFDDELTEPPLVGPADRPLPFAPPPRPTPLPLAATPPRPPGLPDPARWGYVLIVGLIEAAAGRRPLPQLGAMLSPSILRGLGHDLEPVGTTGPRHWLHRAAVRTVRASEPAEGAAELSVTLEVGDRVRAMALRLDEHHGRWRLTRLQLG
ncbi:Rv3235 family protein [Jatrophihabitans fulvus]